MRLNTCIPALLLLLCLVFRANAQEIRPDTTRPVLIQTTDGNEFIGTVLSDNLDIIVVKTDNFGDVSIRKAVIHRIQPLPVSKVSNGRFWFSNPYASRYFAGHTAYGLDKGQWMFQNGWGFFNQLSYGLTDRFSIGAGLAPFIIFDGPFVWWVAPKMSFPVLEGKVHFALGGIYGQTYSSYEDERDKFGAAFGMVTIGSPDINLTIGAGSGSSFGNWSERPIFTLGGTVRTGPRFALVAENYFFSLDGYNTALVAFGGRILGRRLAFDLGIMSYVEDYDLYPLPWVGFHAPLWNRKNKKQ